MTKCLYLIVGPSGAGKTTVVDCLAELGFRRVKSYTTRPPRHEGEDGYQFISEAEYKEMADQIITGTKYHCHYYGATAAQMDDAEIYILEPRGVYAVLENYGKTRPVVVIGITAPMKVLEQRMKDRGDSQDQINIRLEGDHLRFNMMQDFCDIIIRNTGDLQATVSTVVEYMRFCEKTIVTH